MNCFIFVYAVNLVGSTESLPVDGSSLPVYTDVPTPVTDLVVTDDHLNAFTITFTPTTDAVGYDLYRDGSLYASDVVSGQTFNSFDGTWLFQISSYNPKGSVLGDTESGTVLPSLVAPGGIADFAASEDLARAVRFTFSSATDAARYDLYQGTSRIVTDIYTGYVLDTEVAGTWSFFVKAVNSIGSTDSNSDSGTATSLFVAPPTKVEDFLATDTYENQIGISFTPTNDATSYDLYRAARLYLQNVSNGQVFNTFDGTWDFQLLSHNPEGSTYSNEDSGTALPSNEAPLPFDFFTASDDEYNAVVIEFGAPANASRVDLYQDGFKVVEGIQSGYRYLTVDGTWNFFARATNLLGISDSALDEGTALIPLQPPTVITDFVASDTGRLEIIMTYTNALYASSHDLYQE